MEPNRATGDMDPGTTKSTDTETDDSTRHNDSQQTLACRNCDKTNLSRVHGETVAGSQPEGEGPYRCNDCGWHGDPVERPKRTSGQGRRGLAGALASAETDDLRADGGVAPTIYDAVELPDSEQGEPCPRWIGEPPEPCEEPATHVFVHEASLNPDDDRRRNCLACPDCCPDVTAPLDEVRADGGLLTGGRDDVTPPDLTQFQLDILAFLAGDGTDESEDYGLAIKRALEGYYGEDVNHGRLYPNLDDLIEKGFVEKDPLDKRTNQYTLTEEGEYVLIGRLEWLADQIGYHLVDERDHDPVVNGEGGAAGGEE